MIIAVFWKNETLLTAQAFTSLALISLLTTPVIVFTQSLPQVLQCLGNFDRIQEYCNYNTNRLQISKGSDDDDDADSVQNLPFPLEQGLQLKCFDSKGEEKLHHARQEETISIEKQDFAWGIYNTPALREIDISIKRGSITAVVGPVGSGKSTFLHALLGELHPVTSSLPATMGAGDKRREKEQRKSPLGRESIAFCAQQPWLENGTIRDNIVGAEPWDRKRYSAVRLACCLDLDFRQLENGDQTRVGSKGVNLSGGQKQRIVSGPRGELEASYFIPRYSRPGAETLLTRFS